MRKEDRRLTFIGFKPTGDLGGLTCYSNRKRKVVWFIKTYSKKPPSIRQIHQRLKFTAGAKAWQTIGITEQQKWHAAAHAAYLDLTGYTLFLCHTLHPMPESIATIERLSGVQLITK